MNDYSRLIERIPILINGEVVYYPLNNKCISGGELRFFSISKLSKKLMAEIIKELKIEASVLNKKKSECIISVIDRSYFYPVTNGIRPEDTDKLTKDLVNCVRGLNPSHRDCDINCLFCD